jgi:hypothetical protein
MAAALAAAPAWAQLGGSVRVESDYRWRRVAE